MISIKTSKKDIIWNYVGTAVSMASGFLLLPLLIRYLSADELGLWYVYVAVSNLTQLFEFGFSPTFARNIVYCLSGSSRLSKKGAIETGSSSSVDWHMLRALLATSKFVYAVIAAIALIVACTVGSAYIAVLTQETGGVEKWISWGLFCLSIYLNLYFLYSISFLRGVGDVASENKSKTYAKISQLILSAVLLMIGFGLLGASVGFLANGLVLRLFAGKYFSMHEEITKGIASDSSPISKIEIKAVFSEISSIAWRDGAVQIALYASTQATSIVSSLFLGLAETGMYSVMLQLGTAVYNFAGAFVKSYFPTFQASFAKQDVGGMRSIVMRGVSAYWLLCCFGTLGIIVVVFPLLPIIKPGVEVSVPFYLFMTLYLCLLNHHSIFCNFIIGMNEIPYMFAYILSALLGLALSVIFSGALGLGAWGLVGGQFISQIVYNNWKWPRYVVEILNTTYFRMLIDGCAWWSERLRMLLKAS